IKIAITVDDSFLERHAVGPGHTPSTVAEALMAAFARHSISGVYAFSGTAPADHDSDLLRILDQWVERGHFVSNHTHYHANLNWIDAVHYIRDIEKTGELIERWASQSPTRYFRYAMDNWGNTQDKFEQVSAYLSSNKYTTAPINAWFYDTDFIAPHYRASLSKDEAALQYLRKTFIETALQQLRVQAAAARAMFGRDISYIWLIHATPLAAECIGEILEGFATGGAEFIGLDEAMSDPINGQPVPLVTHRFLNHIQKWATVRGLSIDDCPPAIVDEIDRICPMAGLSKPEVMTKVFKGICDEVGGFWIPRTN
ncbi:polysaccharide deacetylase family protein, partial [Rhodopseudomonas sp. B29]|uniref:polysaccharide deacetylase family protein n=1 Tax=Rhodopseudomonas sp. B29 TaxID=95607 RepID=UPI0003B36F92